MANAYTLLANLRAGRCSNTAEVRLLRFWEARNINKGGVLMSVEMLLIDEHATVVQGSIAASRQLMFRERLAEGSVYALSGFDVTRSNPKFRLTDGPVSIRFNDGTAFEKLATTDRVIPTEHFRFRPYEQLIELANTGKHLPDVMGELQAFKSTITDCIPGAQRVMLTLRLESDVNVCVSLFDNLALGFHSKLDEYGKEPRIVLVTGINPKDVSGRIYLNGTSATRVYFDTETETGKHVFDRLPGAEAGQSGSSSKVVHAQKIEPLSVAELTQFVITGDPQIIEFLCTAEVTEIQHSEGWCYIGCAVCSKKLIREETSFTCAPCNVTNAVAELRYRVVLTVSDSTGSAAFVGFDTEVAKLTNVLASEAARIVGVGVNARVDTDFPQALAAIVGKTYTFQLKLTDFNFTASHQTFTISRIFPAREFAPLPTFEENVDGRVASVPDPVQEATVTVADQATSSEGTPAGRREAAEEEPDLEEAAQKKARME